MTLPRSHLSDFTVVQGAGAGGASDPAVEIAPSSGLFSTGGHPAGTLGDETPLFAASLPFARKSGGPWTRRFLETLPEAWGDDVVVHASLVWLTPGLAHDERFAPAAMDGPQCAPPPWRHEPFPGWTTGAQGAANRARGARHRTCAIGGPPREFLRGTVRAEGDTDAFWHPGATLGARSLVLDRCVADGTLEVVSVDPGLTVEHGWGCFWRPTPARTSGFQILLRATWGSGEPHVDGLRNVAFT